MNSQGWFGCRPRRKEILEDATISTQGAYRRSRCFLMMPAALLAGNFSIVFFDLTDTISYTASDNSRVTIDTCPGAPPEQCSVDISAPSPGATVVQFLSQVNIAEAEAGTPVLSDQMTTDLSLAGAGTYFLIFNSLLDQPNPPLCSTGLGAYQMTENGLIQTAGTVVWTDGTIDSLQFQSDAPEPSTSLLLLAALAMFEAGIIRRHKPADPTRI